MPYQPREKKFNSNAKPPKLTRLPVPFMTKEQFLIEWVLARASFREDFSGVAAARSADEVWNKIQELK